MLADKSGILPNRLCGSGVAKKFEVIGRLLNQHFKTWLRYQTARPNRLNPGRRLVFHQNIDHRRMASQS